MGEFHLSFPACGHACILKPLQDLFFKYTWNNFLHTQVQQCLALAITSGHRDNDIIYNNVSWDICCVACKHKLWYYKSSREIIWSVITLDIYQMQIDREDFGGVGQKREQTVRTIKLTWILCVKESRVCVCVLRKRNSDRVIFYNVYISIVEIRKTAFGRVTWDIW